MSLDDFLGTAWSDHGDHPQEVANRLETSLSLVDAPEHVAPYARLVTHVFGEHLGQWDRGIALLENMRASPAFDGSPPVARSVTQGIATLRYAGGDGGALDGLGDDARISVLSTAASAFAGRGDFGRALAVYSEAELLAKNGLPARSPAIRALAIGGNNLALALEEKRRWDENEKAGMVRAAESALKYWKQAGTWLETERAEYRLAKSLLLAEMPAPAIAAAQRCIGICIANDAPLFERFFAHAVLALAERAGGNMPAFESARERAMEILAQLPDKDRQWCAAECEALDA